MTRAAILLEQNWNAVPGGTARSINSLIDALAEHTEIETIGVHGAHRRPPVLALPPVSSVGVVPIPGRLLSESWSRFRRPSVDRFVDADLIHSPAYLLAPTARPSVVTIHDLAFMRHPEWFTPRGVAYFRRFLEMVAKGDSAVIVPSVITADDCVFHGISQDRITVIPWGIDVTTVGDAVADEARVRHRLPERFVLYVGTVEPRKNVTALAAAVASIGNEVPLVVVGPNGWGDVDLPGAVLLGEVANVDVAALMSAAAVLAYPSHFEGFGLPVLEAMAQRTPVLVTAGTAPAVIALDAGIAVDTRSPEAICDALRTILSDPAMSERMGARGRALAANYRWADTASATADVYGSIL